MSRIRSAAVVSNPEKPETAAVEKEVRSFLQERGVRILDSPREADVLVTIGGDGTLLYNKGAGIPVFGIGHALSAICQAKTGDWKGKLAAALEGFSTDTRAMLSCTIGKKRVEDALNDVVVVSSTHRGVWLRLRIDAEEHRFYADGVIFATPTGSTAYSYSCGGAVIPPWERKLNVVAVAPYKRAFSPQTVADSSTFSVAVEKGDAMIVIDGQFVHALKPGETVSVKKSSRIFELVKPAV